MFNNLLNNNVYIIGILIILFVFFLAGIRLMETKRIEKKFPKDKIIISSFGVNYFGLASEPGPPRRSTGALVLHKDGIYYRGRFSNLELFIPGGALTKIEVVEFHKGKPLYQKMLGFTFINENRKLDVAAFRMPHPSQWWTAVETLFLKKTARTEHVEGISLKDEGVDRENGVDPPEEKHERLEGGEGI